MFPFTVFGTEEDGLTSLTARDPCVAGSFDSGAPHSLGTIAVLFELGARAVPVRAVAGLASAGSVWVLWGHLFYP